MLNHPTVGDPADRLEQGGSALMAAKVRMPAVAAIVCNFNQRDFLADAISSMLGQTYPRTEYVVVDDCSTDGSPEVIRDILTRAGNGRVRFIQHDENRGQMAAMLSGLDATSAPFVAWLDADDIWFPQHIERHIAHHLNSQVNAALSTSNMAVIDGEGTVIAGADPSMSTNSPVRKRERTYPIETARLGPYRGRDYDASPPGPPVFVDNQYESWIWSPTSGMVFRRATVEAIRPTNPEKLRICADNYLARFSHIVGGTVWMSETLGYYRLHGGNGFAKHPVYGDGVPVGRTPPQIMVEADVQIARKMFQRGGAVSALMPRRRRLKALLRIARRADVLAELLGDRALARQMPFKIRARLMGRYGVQNLRCMISRENGN